MNAPSTSYVDGHLQLTDDDVVKIGGRRYRFGSVSGFSRKYRENETAAIDRAIERGHRLVWLNLEATMIVGAGTPQPDRSFIAELHVGDTIYVDSQHGDERGFYTVTRERNDNCGLRANTQ
jgi:hypothetical protein